MRDVILEDGIAFARQTQRFAQGFLNQLSGVFIQRGGGGFDPAAGIGEFIMIDDQAAFIAESV